jgi:hypothetical protein
MIVGIANVYLYTGLTKNGAASFEAKEWMDASGIEYTHLHYADPAQHASVFEALGTWFPDEEVAIADFPFVVYEERHDDYSSVQRLLYGLEAITGSNIAELSLLTTNAKK